LTLTEEQKDSLRAQGVQVHEEQPPVLPENPWFVFCITGIFRCSTEEEAWDAAWQYLNPPEPGT